ncbi:MAG: potassium-transporting ATPase subunit KdpA [Bacteriovorax sp.]|nr:potassium-transporting ATPase subunit KdpA [Bacteriovorax sp.]
MSALDFLEIFLTFGSIIVLTPILGKYMAKVFEGKITIYNDIENFIYRILGLDAYKEMNWVDYTLNLIVFNLIGFLFVISILMFQAHLPFNPQHFVGLSLPLAFNVAVSFVTNTNWQSYGGESTMSYFSQMMALGTQNFLSAATGITVLLALVRGLSRKSIAERESKTLGNFWKDLTRSTLFILIPLSIVLALILVKQGTIQNFSSYIHAATIESKDQLLPGGPAASQIAIKQLGTNGGGFFNVNSAHPFENPTPLANWLSLISILLIPAALTYTYGLMIGAKKQGWAIFAAMMITLMVGTFIIIKSDLAVNMMEGKETRLGIINSSMWTSWTTAASNGSVNSMISSQAPIAGGVAMLNIMLGEIIFGGVGSGLYGMILFVILTVFLSGLMVGRTPEYLGKKIESREIKMIILAILAPSACILLGSALAISTKVGLSSLSHQGPHGLSEILYAFTSAAGNNGSALAGLNANTNFYNYLLGFTMIIGRFAILIPVMAIAGSMIVKKATPPSFGTLETDNPIFVVLLIGVIIIVGALTFLPALSLGPIVEQILMNKGILF